ncbi:DUF3592 domain-containing protein [Verrucomicrobiota bacterium sgz303538]
MPTPSRPIAAKKTEGTGCSRVICLVFFVMGSFFLYLAALQPLWQIWSARDWREVPCRILSSDVERSSGSKGPTYRVAISFAYAFDGQSYKSDRYSFFTIKSSGYSRKKEVVDRYPVGSQSICFVNPKKPTEAVLYRGATAALGWGALALPFVAIGCCAFLPSRMFNRRQAGATPILSTGASHRSSDANLLLHAAPDGTQQEQVELKPSISPRTKLIGTIVIALFWNGITSVFVVEAWSKFQAGRPDWFLSIFMMPFVGIGLVLLGAVGQAILGLFNPRISMRVHPAGVRLGDTFEAQWGFRGNVHRIRELRITVEGVERATYRQGKGTRTDENVFVTIPVIETSDPEAIGSGSFRVTVPLDSMPSFKASNNEIAWRLKVRGNIPRFPDVNEEYPLTVLPYASAQP